MSALRDAIVARMQTVPAIGMVQPYERYAHAQDTLKALYVAPGTQLLCGWFVRRLTISETAAQGRGRIEEITWRIQGVMALNDADQSELAFDQLVEQLRDAFRTDTSLGGLVLARTPEGEPAGLQLLDAGAVMFAGVLCHGARLALRTRRLITA